MPVGLFSTIRARCAEVARRARFVRVDEPGLDRLVEDLARAPEPEEDLDPAHAFAGDDETLLAFTLLLDAINFGSGWFPALAKRDGLSGYRTIATACRERFEAAGAPSGAELRVYTPEAMSEMLGQDLADAEVRELMTLFAEAWRDFGSWLGRRHGDRFDSVVDSAEGSAEKLVEALAEMPLYRDVVTYAELEVPFYKRAQITVADLHRAFGEGPLGRFSDLDQLTLFADNLVPHVLRCRGVLRYDPSLLGRIDRGERLEIGSPEEVEIRAVALDVVEAMVTALGERGRSTSAAELDGWLWNAGQAPGVKAFPRHRARGSYY